MSAEATGWVWRHSPYVGVAFAIHLALADSANDQHGYRLFARKQWTADKARTTRKTVREVMGQMVADGMLEVLVVRHAHPTEYRLLLPQVEPMWTPNAGVPRADTNPSHGGTSGSTMTERQVPPDGTTGSTETEGRQKVEETPPTPPREPATTAPAEPATSTPMVEETIQLLTTRAGPHARKLTHAGRHRLERLHATLAAALAEGWTPAGLARALTVDDLADVSSVPAVLTARCAGLGPPPRRTAPELGRPDPGCHTCGGVGLVEAQAARTVAADTPDPGRMTPCPCRQRKAAA